MLKKEERLGSTQVDSHNLNRQESTNVYDARTTILHSWLHMGFILFSSACLVWLSYWGWSHEPRVIPDNDATVGYFSAERAFRHVDHLSSEIGPRAFGTKALERAQRYIWQQLENIQQQYASTNSSDYSLQLEWQIVSGTHITQRSPRSPRSSIYHYQNVTNIIAILCPKNNCNLEEERNRSLLVINGHVDSAISSPGANDDAVACGVLLETIASWIRHPYQSHHKKLRHPVIFLWNGAEETFLNGAHGFVTGWQWIHKVGALLNVESSGAGGLALLFRSGPKNAWLSKAYAKAVTRPHTSVVAQEIFERKLVPSETDFRVFWEFGSIPGIDLANYIHGETYHTFRDAIDRVSLGFIQHMGDTVVQLMEQLVGKEPQDEIFHTMNEEYKNDNAIYYDILGIVTLFGLEKYWNVFYVILLYLCFQSVMKRLSGDNCVDSKLVFYFYLVWFVSLLLTLIGCTSFGWFLHSFCRRSMSWYGRVWLAEWIYGSLGLALVMKLLPWLWYAVARFRGLVSPSSSLYHNITLVYEPIWLSYMLLEATFLVLFLAFRSRLAYLPAWDLLSSLLVSRLFRDTRWCSLVSIVQFIPIAIFRLPCGYMAMAAFVPIMGRIDDRLISDVIIAALCSLFTVLASFPWIIPCTCYAIPFSTVRRFVVALFCGSLVLVAMTRIPFEKGDHPKRLYANHLHVSNAQGEIQQGLFLRGLDARKLSSSLDERGGYRDIDIPNIVVSRWWNGDDDDNTCCSEEEWLGCYHCLGENRNKKRMIEVQLEKDKQNPRITANSRSNDTRPDPWRRMMPRVIHEDGWWWWEHFSSPQSQTSPAFRRLLRLKFSFPKGHMALLSLNASLVNWSLSSTLPVPNSKGWITVHHFRCHDCDDFEFSLVTNNQDAIVVDMVNVVLSPDETMMQLQSLLPDYVALSCARSYCLRFQIPAVIGNKE